MEHSVVIQPKIYDIAGLQYRLEPASFEQHRWLADGPLAGIDFGAGLKESDLEGVIQQRGPDLLGMVLIAEGTTREQKAEAGLDAALKLGRCFARQMTPAEVRAVVHDFFLIDGYTNLVFFIDFRALEARRITDTVPPLTPASVSSPTAIAPSGKPSPAAGDRTTPTSISSDRSSGVPPNAPSLVSAG